MSSMKAAKGPTETLGDFVANLTFEQLPGPVVAQACNVIADAVGCAIGAAADDPEKARIVRTLVTSFASRPEAVIWGSDVAADPALAAFGNGILVNATDFDDTHKRALLHTGSVVVPPALALGQALHLDGRRIVTAVVAGYETAVRVGMAVMPTHYRYWHSTATNGTFGAAAAAASAMSLDPAGARTALGHAGTQAAGLNTFFTSGDFTKSLHPGKAAFNGVLSARLARIGATSPPTVLEHEKGYLSAFSAEPKAAALTAGLGKTWEILQNGFKFFPSILASHSAIQATLDAVREARPDPRAIVSIRNETYETVRTHFSAKAVTTEMGARVSVPYCVAVAALDGTVGQAQFTTERVNRTDVQALLARTETIADPALTTLYPAKFPARVTITLADGRTIVRERAYPKGDPQEPLTPAEIEAKFLANAERGLGATAARELLSLIRALPDEREFSRLGKLLCPRPAPSRASR
ncbi:MAG TPA: MmgE/PrpD family protein [Hyphomicrobiaceae bacterium]|nr:MmgE/PrpD family protein [Hyphomicrobiaceae bacterium]